MCLKVQPSGNNNTRHQGHEANGDNDVYLKMDAKVD